MRNNFIFLISELIVVTLFVQNVQAANETKSISATCDNPKTEVDKTKSRILNKSVTFQNINCADETSESELNMNGKSAMNYFIKFIRLFVARNSVDFLMLNHL